MGAGQALGYCGREDRSSAQSGFCPHISPTDGPGAQDILGHYVYSVEIAGHIFFVGGGTFPYHLLWSLHVKDL